MGRFSLEMAVTIADVRRMNEWLDDWLATAGAHPDVASNMKLCLNEAVSNVVEHGFDTPGAGQMTISLEPLADGLRCTLSDSGRPFDPSSAPEAAPMTDIESSRIGGFGIALMRANSDRLSYRRDGNRNCLIIECHTPAQDVPQ